MERREQTSTKSAPSRSAQGADSAVDQQQMRITMSVNGNQLLICNERGVNARILHTCPAERRPWGLQPDSKLRRTVKWLNGN
jgi:hypothetical protein